MFKWYSICSFQCIVGNSWTWWFKLIVSGDRSMNEVLDHTLNDSLGLTRLTHIVTSENETLRRGWGGLEDTWSLIFLQGVFSESCRLSSVCGVRIISMSVNMWKCFVPAVYGSRCAGVITGVRYRALLQPQTNNNTFISNLFHLIKKTPSLTPPTLGLLSRSWIYDKVWRRDFHLIKTNINALNGQWCDVRKLRCLEALDSVDSSLWWVLVCSGSESHVIEG